MTQDLFDWLNSTHTDRTKDYAGTGGLLLAPILDGQTDDLDAEHEAEAAYTLPYDAAHDDVDDAQHDGASHDDINDTQRYSDINDVSSRFDNASHNDIDDVSSQLNDAPHNDIDDVSSQLDNAPHNDIDDASSQLNDTQHDGASHDDTDDVQHDDVSHDDTDDTHDNDHTSHNTISLLNQAWHEAADFHINLDDPPPQMWTDIDSDIDDDEPKDYEENDSLQGDAYIPVVKHGANFTQRLQATLKGRKDRAAKQHELDAENTSLHPYVQKAIIFCGVLLMTLGFAYFGLWFIRRETPDSLNDRAMIQYENGNYNEAANLYARGYKRYPHVLTFLTGLAHSAEKAGRTQTAIAAWNEYMSSLPKDDTEHRQAAQLELDKLIPGGETQTQTKAPDPPKPQTITLPQTKPSLPSIKHTTFDESLTEGNSLFNIGMFSRAISSFHRAHAIRPDDLRPYVGLIASYRSKGMFFDAKRLLDEARRKFGQIPELEMESYYLRRE